MNKYTILEHIEIEKELSLQWIERARSIVEGYEISKEYFPIYKKPYEFFNIFYTEFDAFSMNQLEAKYKNLHATYREIFQIYFEINEIKYERKNLIEKDKIVVMEGLIFLEAITNEFITYLNIIEKNLNLIIEHSSLEKAS